MSDVKNVCLPAGDEADGVRVFTIAYGVDADQELLKRIAWVTQGTFSEANSDSILDTLSEILYQ